jgi:uroporphyrinogen-III synthase
MNPPTAPPPPSLAGATLVVTRPAPDAAALVRPIRALHGRPLPLPGLSLRASDAGAAQLRAADRYDGWIFVSPAAVRFAFRAAPSLRMADGALICCVGAGTRRALARRGLAAIAPDGRADSEGLLALPELVDVRGRRFALVGAPGGRDLIATTLRARGAEVEPVHVYERVPPRWTARQLRSLAQAAEPLITLVSSGEALSNLVARLPRDALQRLRSRALVVGSERLAALARANAFADVHVAASALPEDLLNAAQKVLARHRL